MRGTPERRVYPGHTVPVEDAHAFWNGQKTLERHHVVWVTPYVVCVDDRQDRWHPEDAGSAAEVMDVLGRVVLTPDLFFDDGFSVTVMVSLAVAEKLHASYLGAWLQAFEVVEALWPERWVNLVFVDDAR